MKPAFSYYGGKQKMAPKIVPLIPKHTVYVEPFAGGLAVFFAKPWPAVSNTSHYREVVNDTDGRIVNFYQQLRDEPEELVRRCMLTPYSREEHTITARQETDDPIEAARRWYVDIQQSFANVSRGGWGTGVFGRNFAVTWCKQLGRLGEGAERMIGVHIEHDDALKVIQRWDSPQTFFYCDPPYPGADQGHYKGYTEEDFAALVETLDGCQGSFLLSCYGADVPDHWEKFEFTSHCSASRQGQAGKGRDKTRAATKAEQGNRKRTEVVYRVVRGDNVRPEIQRLYDAGKFDCFEAKAPACHEEPKVESDSCILDEVLLRATYEMRKGKR